MEHKHSQILLSLKEIYNFIFHFSKWHSQDIRVDIREEVCTQTFQFVDFKKSIEELRVHFEPCLLDFWPTLFSKVC